MASYTHVHLPDVEDLAPRFGLGEHQAARFANDALGTERTGLALLEVRPHARPPFTHRHDEAEEVYVVVSGSGRIHVDGEVVELRPLDAIRIAPRAWRHVEAGPAGLRYVAAGARHEGDGEVGEPPAAETAATPPAPGFSAVLAAVPVADAERAHAFYARLLGRPADERPMDGLLQWTEPGAGTLQVAVDPGRAGGGMVTLLTADLDAHLAVLGERGLDVPGRQEAEVVAAVAVLEDPDGNSVVLTQPR